MARFIPADEWLSQQRKRFIPADEWLNDYSIPESEPIEIKEDEGESYCTEEPKNDISSDQEEDFWSNKPKTIENLRLALARHGCTLNYVGRITYGNSEHLNKIDEAVILHHEGVKAFINQYNDVQVLKAFYFQATNRFLIFSKDLKVKKKRKEEYVLYWWDWKNRITTRTGDYIDCYFKYRELINLMGNPSPITLPEPPDLTEYHRNVTYCAADGKRCEQFTLALGV